MHAKQYNSSNPMDEADQMLVDGFAKLNMGGRSGTASEKKRRPVGRHPSQYTMANDPNLHLDDDEMI